jgi:nicotinamidase-related amidase
MIEPTPPYALLVIDVQQGLFERKMPIYNAQTLLANLHSLIALARQQDALVVYVQHSNDALLRKGTHAWQLHPSLHPQPEDLRIEKLHGSAFEKTALGEELTRCGIHQLVICGLVTHGCVKAGTLDALKLGYQTRLITDAHSNYSKDAAKLIVEWNTKLGQAGAQLSTTREFVGQE